MKILAASTSRTISRVPVAPLIALEYFDVMEIEPPVSTRQQARAKWQEARDESVAVIFGKDTVQLKAQQEMP